MTTVAFLLEEPSARDLLQGLVPRLLPESVEVQYVVFQGKQDLERNVVRRIRGWLKPDTHFVVLRDQDAAPCFPIVRDNLSQLASTAGRPDTLIRIACRELEAWVLGDLDAVAAAFDRPAVTRDTCRRKYRNPDCLVRPVEELRKLVPGYQKRSGARLVGPLLDLDGNRSPSFHAFCKGLVRFLTQDGQRQAQSEDNHA